MIDSHCHLADDAFAEDLPAVVERARAAGVTHALCILAAGNAIEAERARGVVASWPDVRTAAGVHPHQAAEFEGREDEAIAPVLAHLERDPQVRAIGEIGLDYHYDFAPREAQRRVFRAQVQLAHQRGLPIVVHTREAEDDTLAILREESRGDIQGVLHCFTGTRALAEQALALGMHVSFAGIITFPRAAELRELVPIVPADRLLCETDSPYLAPTPHRGKRNEPAWVSRVVEELARARGLDTTGMSDQLTANFMALFRP